MIGAQNTGKNKTELEQDRRCDRQNLAKEKAAGGCARHKDLHGPIAFFIGHAGGDHHAIHDNNEKYQYDKDVTIKIICPGILAKYIFMAYDIFLI